MAPTTSRPFATAHGRSENVSGFGALQLDCDDDVVSRPRIECQKLKVDSSITPKRGSVL
jgi:hypothetical protein